MRNLILFFQKYSYTITFCLLQLIAFSFIYSNNQYHNSTILSSYLGVSGSVYSFRNEVTEYFSLKQTNSNLIQENTKLRNQLKANFIKKDKNVIYINDTIYRQRFVLLDARVISNNLSGRNNFLIIDKGADDGVEAEMAVVSNQGIVGIIKDVSKSFCSVYSILSQKTNYTAEVQKNGFFGRITWEPEDDVHHVTLSDIPSHIDISIRDEVITKGSSGLFPPGTKVGKISEFNSVPGSDYYKIKIELSTNFKSLKNCYVVKDLLKMEIDSLETLIQQ